MIKQTKIYYEQVSKSKHLLVIILIENARNAADVSLILLIIEKIKA